MRSALLPILLATACQMGKAPPEATRPETPVLAAVAADLPAWRFIEVDGDVRIDGKPAKADMAIQPTSTIVTAAGAHALITLGKKSLIEVRENTELSLGSSERKKISARLLAGELWSFFDRSADYEVVTENAVAGVRGTVFYVNAQDPKETVVCACSHEVTLESLDPRKPTTEEVTATEWQHIATSFKRRGKRVKTKSLGTLANPDNHPDARGKELLARMPR